MDIEKIKKIERETIAFELHYSGFDAHGNRIEFNALNIRFKDIENAVVGDKFAPEEGNLQNYSTEIAEVIYKTDSDAIVRICFIEEYNYEYDESFDMIHIVFN